MPDSPIAFHNPSLGSKPVLASFDGGNVTSDGGLLWFSEVDRKLGMAERLSSMIVETRDPRKIVHSNRDLIRERMFAIAAGSEDSNDLNDLRHDPALQTACGKKLGKALGSQPTVSRFENRLNSKDLLAMGVELARIVVEQLPADTRSVMLDVDASEDPCHGQQQFRFFNGFYGSHCYLPHFLHVTGNDGVQRLMGSLLRRGNAGACVGLFSLLGRAIGLLKERFPKIEITLRADCAYGVDKVLRFCKANSLSFIIGLTGNSVLLREVWMETEEVRRALEVAGKDQKVFVHFLHKAKSWAKAERVVAKVETVNGKLNVRFVITSDTFHDPEAIYRIYSGRGEQENRIKEMKLGLLSGRTSCHNFLANQLRLLLHTAACVLWRSVQDALAGSEWANQQIGTLRLVIIKVGARVINTTRGLRFRLPTSSPHQGVWNYLQQSLHPPQG